jgi:hypothetical protein
LVSAPSACTLETVHALLFSYGSLQEEDVQLTTFGRRLNGQRDELVEFAHSLVRIDDPDVAAKLGKTHHANVELTGNQNDRVPGMAFEITDVELDSVDAYERVFSYERLMTTLASGRPAWVYACADSSGQI